MPLKQYGGEGTEKYKGKKSDQSLPQHGGEGKSLKVKSDIKLSQGTSEHRGPGATLKIEPYGY